jgi:hypothetical protein
MEAKERADAFVDAVDSEEFGKCPNPPLGPNGSHFEKLSYDMSEHVFLIPGSSSVEVSVSAMNKAEIRYCLKVCRKLGFKPKWTR